MILLIRCHKEVKSYNNWITAFNSEMSDVNEVFINNGFSTLLLYKRRLPHEMKFSTLNKRGFKSLDELDLTLIKSDCIIIYHADIINHSRQETIEKLFKFCHETDRHLILQFSLETQHLINHISTGSEVYIDREQLDIFLIELDRDLKLKKILS